MKTLKLYSKGTEVLYLQQLLNTKGYRLIDDGDFGQLTLNAVIDFQKSCGLVADGIVGDKTWTKLLDENEPKEYLTELDYIECAQLLGVDVATVKAVKEVESGSIGGFFKSGHPTILFEGHVFWNELKKRNKKPESFVKGNEDILYPKWTKKHYSSEEGEVNRLSKAMKIDKIAALSSASWGMFQIMGFNHQVVGYDTVEEFVEAMETSVEKQVEAFCLYVINTYCKSAMNRKDFAEFARKYNGPNYHINSYDTKLETYYNELSEFKTVRNLTPVTEEKPKKRKGYTQSKD
jgi:hypothetical protein